MIPTGYPQRMLTARAASNTTIVKEIIAWSIMSSLAHGESTGASVGDKAVLVLKARNSSHSAPFFLGL